MAAQLVYKRTELGFSTASYGHTSTPNLGRPYGAGGNAYSHAGAKGTYGAALGWDAQWAAATPRERGLRSLSSGARALR
eukprot:132535-Pleurochrysis_carterae.AAC.1